MRMKWVSLGVFMMLALIWASAAQATVFGTIRGIVHDPQHRPIAGAQVMVKSATSSWSQETQTNSDGEFTFAAVAFGEYTVSAKASGFAELQQAVTLASDTSEVLHLQLSIASVSQTAVVTSEAETSAQETFTPTTLVSREDIERTPGADLTNSLAMITDFTPAAYHDARHAAHARRPSDFAGSSTAFPFPTRTSPRASLRASLPRTSTTSRCCAAATTRNTATAPTACSTSSRSRAST